jgi:hypothetical protein
VRQTSNLRVALPEEELQALWEDANVAVGRLLAGLLGRRGWDDDVQALHGAVYDEICGNGFDANLYNALTISLCNAVARAEA